MNEQTATVLEGATSEGQGGKVDIGLRGIITFYYLLSLYPHILTYNAIITSTYKHVTYLKLRHPMAVC